MRRVQRLGRLKSSRLGASRRVTQAVFVFFSSRRRHTRLQGDWSSDVCSSDLVWKPWQRITKTRTSWQCRKWGRIALVGMNGSALLKTAVWSIPFARAAPDGALSVEAPVCAAPVFSLGRPARARTSSGGRKDGRIHGSCAGSPFWTIYRNRKVRFSYTGQKRRSGKWLLPVPVANPLATKKTPAAGR